MKEYVKLRLEKSKSKLKEAKILLKSECYNSSASSAYYSIFHAMHAVLGPLH